MTQLAPIPSDFTSAVATREFELVRDAVASKLLVEIGTPVQDVESLGGTDWRCPVRFSGGETTRVQSACGVDSFQALHLAFRLVQVELDRLTKDEQATQVLFLGAAYDADTHLPIGAPGLLL
ncbi:DUF6968 family protein [Caldimonas brevitalea]|uniref:DUF6968 family protein n=1 Tax=Caldimonas brevitalea TaxID=413882 RepID=UPI003AA7EB85